MADEIPTVQILDKKNYFQQTLLHLHNALPYPPLGPSSLRLRTTVLSLTVNNFTYAALGTLLNWWDVHPLPPSTPAPYNDANKYGRISAWGYAEVLESTVPGITKGSHVWGYVPLGTLAQDLEVKPHPNSAIKDQIFVTSAYRQHVMPIYNRYFLYPEGTGPGIRAEIAKKTPGIAYDALLRVMHATAFLMASFTFSSDPKRIVAPAPGPDDALWSAEDADLRDATVLILAPGSKVGVAFAALLRSRSSEEDQGRPRRIIGVSSEASKSFVDATGVYDAVVLTSADPVATIDQGQGDTKRIVIFDFGGRAGAGVRWASSLAPRDPNLLFVGIGSEIIDPANGPPSMGGEAAPPPFKVVRANADAMRRRAIKQIGEERYWAEEGESWAKLRKDGVKGFGVTWGEGMHDVINGWDRLARGEILPSEGLVFKL